MTIKSFFDSIFNSLINFRNTLLSPNDLPGYVIVFRLSLFLASVYTLKGFFASFFSATKDFVFKHILLFGNNNALKKTSVNQKHGTPDIVIKPNNVELTMRMLRFMFKPSESKKYNIEMRNYRTNHLKVLFFVVFSMLFALYTVIQNYTIAIVLLQIPSINASLIYMHDAPSNLMLFQIVALIGMYFLNVCLSLIDLYLLHKSLYTAFMHVNWMMFIMPGVLIFFSTMIGSASIGDIFTLRFHPSIITTLIRGSFYILCKLVEQIINIFLCRSNSIIIGQVFFM